MPAIRIVGLVLLAIAIVLAGAMIVTLALGGEVLVEQAVRLVIFLPLAAICLYFGRKR